jgi:hypothetical protein
MTGIIATLRSFKEDENGAQSCGTALNLLPGRGVNSTLTDCYFSDLVLECGNGARRGTKHSGVEFQRDNVRLGVWQGKNLLQCGRRGPGDIGFREARWPRE